MGPVETSTKQSAWRACNCDIHNSQYNSCHALYITRVHKLIAISMLYQAEYWRQRTTDSLKAMYVEYGNDLEGTGFTKGASEKLTVGDTKWNLSVKLSFFIIAYFHKYSCQEMF